MTQAMSWRVPGPGPRLEEEQKRERAIRLVPEPEPEYVDRVDAVVSRFMKELERSRVAPSVKRMIFIHVTKPWIRNFKAMAIAPIKSGLERHLGPVLFTHGGHRYHFPSPRWWLAHAKASHPPHGKGCDPRVHTDFLTSTGKHAEFRYAHLLTTGEVWVIGRRDFEIECAWWNRHAG